MPEDKSILVRVNNGWKGKIDVTFTNQTHEQLNMLINASKMRFVLDQIENVCLHSKDGSLKIKEDILVLLEDSELLR